MRLLSRDPRARYQGGRPWGGRLVFAGLVSVGVAYTLLLASFAWRGDLVHGDFLVFFSASHLLVTGNPAALYDAAALLAAQQDALNDHAMVRQAMPFLNPPHTALLFIPFAALPYPEAALAWAAAQVGLLAWIVSRSLQAARHWDARERWFLTAAILAFPPVFISIALGNCSLLMVVCLWMFYHALRAEQPGRAGLWLALGALKPQMWVLMVVLLIATRQWRVLGTAAGLGLGAGFLTTVITGPHIWVDWLQSLARNLHTGEGAARMYNIKGLLTGILGDSAFTFTETVSWFALLGAILLTAWLWRRPELDHGGFDARFALTATLALLVSPHANPHDGAWLIVPATLTYGLLRRSEGRHAIMATLLVTSPLLFIVGDLWLGFRLGVQVPAILTILLAGWLACFVAGHPRPRPATGSGHAYS